MHNLDLIKLPEQPWSLRTAEPMERILPILSSRLDTAGGIVCHVDGGKMQTNAELFAEFGRQLKFPSYYGQKSNALNDCITDLEWLPAKSYVVVISNSESVFARQHYSKEEPRSNWEWLLRKWDFVGTQWGTPDITGNWWDRPALPFHFLFLTDPNAKKPMPSELAALPILIFD